MSLEFTKCYENNNSKKPLNLLSITCYVILDSYLLNKKNKKIILKLQLDDSYFANNFNATSAGPECKSLWPKFAKNIYRLQSI